MEANQVSQTQKVILFQSGGRDSTAAAAHLLDDGWRVIGVTLANGGEALVDLPRQRAVELSERYRNYCWGMFAFDEWDNKIKQHIRNSVSAPLPSSCLPCALSKITAVIPFAKAIGVRSISLGYTNYQGDWAEQTEYAVNLQRQMLSKYGFDLLLPAQKFTSKQQVIHELKVKGLTPDSLENPCCVSAVGTQDVPDLLVRETVEGAFDFFDRNRPIIEKVSEVGDFPHAT